MFMPFLELDFPQVTYQFVRPGSTIDSGHGPTSPTKFIHDMVRARRHVGRNMPSERNTSPRIGSSTSSAEAQTLFDFDSETPEPIDINISVRNETDFNLLEIQSTFNLGDQSFTFALRFSEDGSTPQLVEDPFGENERVIPSESKDYQKKVNDLAETIKSWATDPSSQAGRSYTGLNGRVIFERVNIEHSNIANQALLAIGKHFQQKFDR